MRRCERGLIISSRGCENMSQRVGKCAKDRERGRKREEMEAAFGVWGIRVEVRVMLF